MNNILVIDDEEIVRKKIKKVLVDKNYNVEEATDGQNAIDILQNKSFDLIILDVVMPNKGGLDTLFELSSIVHDKIKIIMISGKAPSKSELFMSLLSNFGSEKFLQKPFRKKELLDTVEQLLKS